jgi:hypothetical protein
MTWFANGLLFDRRGTFPAQSHNVDPADARLRRYEDCHELLEGWLIAIHHLQTMHATIHTID